MIVSAAMAALAAAAPPALPQAVMDGILHYTECAAIHANQRAGGSDPAEAIAEAAVRACAEEERRALGALTEAFGPGAANMIVDVRAGARRTALSTIAIRRGTAPNGGVNDSFSRWGACLGDRGAAHRRLSAGAAADAALQECVALESAARSDAIGRLGPESGEAAVRSFREHFRGMIARSRAGARR
jgi:hypothetical protein